MRGEPKVGVPVEVKGIDGPTMIIDGVKKAVKTGDVTKVSTTWFEGGVSHHDEFNADILEKAKDEEVPTVDAKKTASKGKK
jgi:hypothetical protein